MGERGPLPGFKKEYCQMLIDHMAQGHSFDTFGAVVGISRSGLFKWCKQYPEFQAAKEVGYLKAYYWWEKKAIDHAVKRSWSEEDGKGFKRSESVSLDTNLWKFRMINHFKYYNKHPDEGADVNITVSLADKIAEARKRAELKKKSE